MAAAPWVAANDPRYSAKLMEALAATAGGRATAADVAAYQEALDLWLAIVPRPISPNAYYNASFRVLGRAPNGLLAGPMSDSDPVWSRDRLSREGPRI